MQLRGQIARAIVSGHPATLTRRLLRDDALNAVEGFTRVHFSHLDEFEYSNVEVALQKAISSGQKVSLKSSSGAEFYLERSDVDIRLSSEKGPKPGVSVPEFAFLDPDVAMRRRALKNAVSICFPVMPSHDHWSSLLSLRPLKGYEVGMLVTDLHHAPNHVLASIEKKWNAGEATTETIFPTVPAYYEGLVGPISDIESDERYVADVLLPHLEQAVVWRPPVSMHIALGSCIGLYGHELAIGLPDEELAAGLAEMPADISPMALTAGIGLALPLARHSDAFNSFLDAALARTLKKSFSIGSEIDAYQALSALTKACLRYISTKEGIWQAPAYWRRRAALAHAQLILSALASTIEDTKSLVEWCDGIVTPNMIAAEMIDVQRGPLWQETDISPGRLRAECIVTIANLAARYEPKSAVPSMEMIRSAYEDISTNGTLALCASVGLIDEAGRVSELKDVATSQTEELSERFDRVKAELIDGPTRQTWSDLTRTCRLVQFDNTLLECLGAAIEAVKLEDGEEARQEFFTALGSAALVAAVQPSEKVAESVVSVILREASKFSTPRFYEPAYRIVLLVAASLPDRQTWLKWLSAKLSELAFALPRGEPCASLAFDLEAFTAMLPVEDQILGRARQAAIAAF